jgi:O-acetyl-ADP-ribose deacetylase (regulator of RNase III)
MPAQWVIHVVGPNFRRGERDRSLLISCYERALAVADDLGARTVAFPLISAGSYGWPKLDAIDAALEVFRAARTRVLGARMVAFSAQSHGEIVARLKSVR